MEKLFLIDPLYAQRLCRFPERLHPVSETILENYLTGKLLAHEFLRYFSLPNSDYIPLAHCFIAVLTGADA